MTSYTVAAPQDVLERIQKLLRLADRNSSAAEAASAASKAQALLEEWNLDVAAVENATGADGRREDAKVKGGFYRWQRWLWQSVANLNFCLYFVVDVWDDDVRITRRADGRTQGKYVTQHRLVGRRVNVAATRHLVVYLEREIERLVAERTQGASKAELYGNWANSYRSGISMTLTNRLEERRRERVDAAAKAAKEAAERAGTSTSTALTLADIDERERDANQDFLYGEGFSAKKAAQRAAQAEARRLAEEEHTRWAAANPEAARKEEAARRAKFEKQQSRRGSSRAFDNIDRSAYWSGRDAGKAISLDQQVDTPRATAALPGRRT